MSGAILFDRDGTLIVDRPGSTDPRDVALMPFAREAVALARDGGYRVGVVTNQPGIARGDIDHAGLERLHRRVEELIGRIDGWFVCPHEPVERCACRKPMPGLIHAASRAFAIEPERCVVIGDIGSDIDAAHAVGARAVLVPTPVTRRSEIERAPSVARDVLDAVSRVLSGAL